MSENPKIAFFGTPDIAVWVLDELQTAGIVPQLVVTTKDRRQGRGMELTPPPVKVWAQQHGIEVFQPDTLTDETSLSAITAKEWDLFVVAAYGAIMPQWLIRIPAHGTLNVHPSLLPKLRGASPIRTAILQDMRDCGVSIMLMDAKMDHGAIVAQEPCAVHEALPGRELDFILAKQGGALLARVIPSWLHGTLVAKEQDHTQATYSKKFSTKDAQIDLDPYDLPQGADAKRALLKIYAYDGNPGAFFMHNGKRVKIISAHLQNGTLVLERVTPEGKKPMSFAQFLQSIALQKR